MPVVAARKQDNCNSSDCLLKHTVVDIISNIACLNLLPVVVAKKQDNRNSSN